MSVTQIAFNTPQKTFAEFASVKHWKTTHTGLFREAILWKYLEGFESLALTCRGIHALCTPFLKRHNQLRLEFHRLALGKSSTITTLLHLILRIDSEPIIARYITHADFGCDRYHPYIGDFYRGHHGPLKNLLADSPYLKKAGLDWKEYHELIKADLRRNRYSKNYSQHVTAFVLTLLPNVKTLVLSPWQPLEAPKKLLEAIFAESKLSTFPCEDPSLAQLTKIKISTDTRLRFDLWQDFPLLALPNLRSYRGPNFVARAIEGEAGSYLEELSIKICASTSTEDTSLKDRPIVSIAPNEFFMRGFKSLRKLELPLEIAICDHANAAFRETKSKRILANQGPRNFEIFINELLPASVSYLSLSSDGMDIDARRDIMEAIGDYFVTEQSRFPSTKEIQLLLPEDHSAIYLYKENHSEAAGEVDKPDVPMKYSAKYWHQYDLQNIEWTCFSCRTDSVSDEAPQDVYRYDTGRQASRFSGRGEDGFVDNDRSL
ncbi:hypothetical protein BCON_0006g00300 [Botryotinia convoluta]|uniref:F-box domain-containing protein n=1 Tax=Botryotinia convoluta TaxID=54673 RepID=A0A4Z1IT31_9HELO|nr:hypothetical protein BCON_0006g00300 [Botryotinia convoluta]